MKNILVFLCFLVCLVACNNGSETTITGTVEGLQPGDHLVLVGGAPHSPEKVLLGQTTVTKPGQFELSTTETGTAAMLYHVEEGGDTSLEGLNPGMNSLLLFLDGYADLKVTGELDMFFLAEVTGGFYDLPDMKKMNELNRQGAMLQQQGYQLMQQGQMSGDEDLQEQGRAQMQQGQQIFGELIPLQNEFLKNHPDLGYSALLLRYDHELLADIDAYEAQFLALSPKVQNSVMGEDIRQLISQIRATRPGGTAPEFELPSLDGSRVKLSDMKGKYVILDFWGSWCGPCRAAAPHLVEFYNEIKDNENIVMVGIGVWEQSADNWRQAIEEDALPWLQLLDEEGTVPTAYVIDGVPHTILISPEGIIMERKHPLALLPEIKGMLGI